MMKDRVVRDVVVAVARDPGRIDRPRRQFLQRPPAAQRHHIIIGPMHDKNSGRHLCHFLVVHEDVDGPQSVWKSTSVSRAVLAPSSGEESGGEGERMPGALVMIHVHLFSDLEQNILTSACRVPPRHLLFPKYLITNFPTLDLLNVAPRRRA